MAEVSITNHIHKFKTSAPNSLTADEAFDLSAIKGKVILMTGATNGLGAACLDAMCEAEGNKPIKVVLVSRNAKLADAKKALLEKNGILTTSYIADLSSPAQVVRVCDEILAAEPVLHTLGLNAGAWLTNSKREMNVDGYEMMYCVNFLQVSVRRERA